MQVVKTALEGVALLEPVVHGDERGYFVETYRRDVLAEALGFDVKFVQDNESKSGYGVLRGLHYQLPPYAQSKLVRVIHGSVYDVAVDLRVGSPTFGRSVGYELSAANKRQLFIPRGFAHGFVVTSDSAVFVYKVDQYYAPQHDRGIAYNDPTIAVDWGVAEADLKLSDKDRRQPLLSETSDLFEFGANLYA